jgi:hypothetical protein
MAKVYKNKSLEIIETFSRARQERLKWIFFY